VKPVFWIISRKHHMVRAGGSPRISVKKAYMVVRRTA
jgi:hypothetical protein